MTISIRWDVVGRARGAPYDRVVKTILSASLALALSASAVLAEDEWERCGELPPAVAQTRQAIHEAAAARDYAALAKLADPDEFVYSFGEEGGDPVAYWQAVDREGTDIRATIGALLEMSCAVLTYEEMVEYVWPAAADAPYAELTAEETAALEALYAGEVEAQYIEGTEIGYYVGWRLYIAEDGRWTAFVAGD
jgi:hypothetical protein